MGNGPRDWSPPGYWDDRPASRVCTEDRYAPAGSSSRHGRRRGAWGILALLFGCAALALVFLPLWTSETPHLVWTTVGLSGVFFGVTHLIAHRRGLADGRVSASVGVGAGAIASALVVWGVAWAELPDVPDPPQIALAGLFAPSSAGTAAAPIPGQSDQTVAVEPAAAEPEPIPVDTAQRGYELRVGRAVPPTANAEAVMPQHQLQANLVATAYEVCAALKSYRAQRSGLPASLTVGDDGRIGAESVTFSAVLAAYMRLSYAPSAPDGAAFLTIADIESGMAMSCVHSGDEGWITNS